MVVNGKYADISIKAFLCVNVETAFLLENIGVKVQHCFLS